jgi:membrane protein YqaA with SNARE-associated domain
LYAPHGPASHWAEISNLLQSWGSPGLLLLSLLDSVGLPIVGGVDALLIAVAMRQPRQAYLAAMCAIAGSIVGSLVLFVIARRGGELLLEKHIRGQRGARLHAWFEEYGLLTVFIPALSPIPLPMKIPVFCAGALNVRISYFAGVLLVARTLRYFGLAYLGSHYGPDSGHFLRTHIWAILAITIALGLLAVGIIHLMRRRSGGRVEEAVREK